MADLAKRKKRAIQHFLGGLAALVLCIWLGLFVLSPDWSSRLIGIGLYLTVWLALTSFFASRQVVADYAKSKVMRESWRWFFRWHLIVLLLTLIGAILGGITFVLVGTLAGIGESVLDRLYAGIRNGGFYFFIWAPGLSIVLEIIEAKKRYFD